MSSDTSQPLTAGPLSQADIRQIFVGIMLAMLLSALDQTIVATAMPTIGRDLGDVAHLPWVVTAYLLASTAVTPLYGKFSDMHGRRVTMLIGITIFIVGSVACALAPNMIALVMARGLQGIGGGGLMALSQTIVADMVTPRERGRYQVYFGAVFASASVGGPVLGGFLAENLHWSAIFWINLPLGALALWLVNGRLKKLPRHDRRHRLDIAGAAIMTSATILSMLVLSWGGVRFPWTSPPLLALAGAALLLWAGFGLRMRTAAEPLIPLEVLRDRVVATATAASALGMGTYIGLTIFVPIFFETALGMSARDSGVALIPWMIGIVMGSTASGRSMARLRHYKRIPLAGLTLALSTVAALALFAGSLPFWAIEVLLMATSLGVGTLMPVTTVSVQNSVPGHHLGTATAVMNFSRQISGAMIVAVFGAIVLGGSAAGRGVTLESLSGGARPELAPTFQWVFGAATLGLSLCLSFFTLMEERPFRDRTHLAAAPPAEAGAAT